MSSPTSSEPTARRVRAVATKFLVVLVLLVLRASAHACPVCFGSTEGNVLRAYYLSALALTLLPFLIVGLTIAALLHRRRRDSSSARKGRASPEAP